MIRPNCENKIKEAFLKEYRGLPEASLEVIIKKFFDEVDDRLADYVNDYIETGDEREYVYGEYSLMLIESLQKVGYLEAVRMLNTYMVDPVKGQAQILRPSFGRRFSS